MQALFSFDRTRLAALANEHRDAYRSAEPFPHVVLDDFLDPRALDAVLGEFPQPSTPGWFRFDSDLEQKLASDDTTDIGPATRQLLHELNDAAMVDFLGGLTGIEGLVPDPHLVGGGLHQIEPGGFLNIHADFNVHPLTRLYRRLNLLLYLNRGWDPDWGGALELWDGSMQVCRASIQPIFNRCVIFSTTAHSFHGHPAPLLCPPGTTRKSLALYYYSREPDPSDRPESHNTLFQVRADLSVKRPGRARRWAIDLLPPVLVRSLRALRERVGTGR